MKTFGISFFVFILAISTTMAQDSIPPKFAKKNNFSGFYAGATTGIGFSYRHNFGKFGIQLSGLPIGNKDDLWVNAGLQLSYIYHSSPQERIQLFTYLGTSLAFNHLLISEYPNCYCSPGVYCPCYELPPKTYYDDSYAYNLGIGSGMDIRLNDITSLEILLGYGIYNLTDDYKFMLDAGFGFFFRF